MNFTKEEREAYEGHLKWLRMEFSALKKYEQKYREEGEARGIKIGEARGIQIGEARGIQIGEAKLIKMMIENGSSIEEIARMTKLSIAKINELLKDLLSSKQSF
jgi:predicted transposase YdaD